MQELLEKENNSKLKKLNFEISFLIPEVNSKYFKNQDNEKTRYGEYFYDKY